ncbi:branched-chain amino acid ABC transporter permease [Natronococcus wangiae]|uniref:branched-chain amino acid ABC transporter permease n=1 Tax=Natronococcus wangiae TaxID=3068275 RepID=UPI00273FF6AF|nr:branched-chain amino acid ABC transporter permease [Natronococcus sp. AD5]
MSETAAEDAALDGIVREYRDIGITLAVLAVLPAFVVEAGMTYQARLLVLFLTFASLTIALNVVFGHTNQLFLFVGALTGIGAYTTALLADSLGVSAWLLVPVSGLVAGSIGLLVSYVSARRGMTVIVIAILTLALQLAFGEIFVGARDITGGSTGIPFRELEVEFLATALGETGQIALYYVLLAFVGALLVGYRLMMNSKYGFAFKAIRQDEIAAESVGIDVVKYKSIAGFAAAAVIGLVGPLYAQSEGYILPSMFAFQSIDVLVLVMLVLGGMRTLIGPVVGAGVIIYVNEILQDAGQWRTAILGGLLIALFLYFREGIVPKVRELRNGELGVSAPGSVLDRLR